MSEAAAVVADVAATSLSLALSYPARLCAHPLTAAQARTLLNANGVTEPPGDSYRYVNRYNRDLPLVCDPDTGTFDVRPGLEDHPVTGVTWAGALLLAEFAGGRLPTVEEWELAAGGAASVYPWGDDPPAPDRANYDEHVGAATAVGAYPPTGAGFYDLAGNVGEWCARTISEAREPHRTATSAVERVVKGGGWNKPPDLLRTSSYRCKWGRIGTVGIGVRLLFDRE